MTTDGRPSFIPYEVVLRLSRLAERECRFVFCGIIVVYNIFDRCRGDPVSAEIRPPGVRASNLLAEELPVINREPLRILLNEVIGVELECPWGSLFSV